MRLSLAFITVFVVFGVSINAEKTDIELDAKATKLHQIDSLVSIYLCSRPRSRRRAVTHFCETLTLILSSSLYGLSRRIFWFTRS